MTFQTLRLHKAHIGNHFHAYGLRGHSEAINPFINIDHARMSAPTFAPHPHAGFSAVSYVFEDSETGIHNRDSMGSDNIIQAGGVHWAAAGSGMVHEENPAEAGKTVHSLQIFVRLPPGREGMAPFAVGLAPDQIPEVAVEGGKVRVVSGQFGATVSPLNPPTDVTMLDIVLQPGAALKVPVAAGLRALVLPVKGVTAVNGRDFAPQDLNAPLFAEQPNGAIALQAQSAAQVMVFIGKALP